MILKTKSVNIHGVDKISEDLEKQMLMDKEIDNMSEVKQYPPDMPAQLIFEIY